MTAFEAKEDARADPGVTGAPTQQSRIEAYRCRVALLGSQLSLYVCHQVASEPCYCLGKSRVGQRSFGH
jgi:hypothetical protein